MGRATIGLGRDPRGMIGAVALVILTVIAVLGLSLLTVADMDRFYAARARARAEAFYVADGGMQGVLPVLKVNANNVVGATYPVVPGLLVSADDWGFSADNYPGGITFNNMPSGQFTPNNPSSNVVITMPIGRGTAQVTVWLKSVGATLADPVVFGLTSVGRVPDGRFTRTVMSDITLVARGGRPPNPLQTGGLGGPVLDYLTDGGTSISGTVQRAGASVEILKRVGNSWVPAGATVTAANAPAGGPYAFTMNTAALVRGETYSAKSQDGPGAPWSPLAFPMVVQ